jgi:hypothetical protein
MPNHLADFPADFPAALICEKCLGTAWKSAQLGNLLSQWVCVPSFMVT